NGSSLAYIASGAPGYDPKLGVLQATQADWLGTAGIVHFDLLDAPGTVPVAALTGIGMSDPKATYSTNMFFANVPPRQAIEATGTRADGVRVSRRTVLVASEWFTRAHLYPLTT